MGLLALLKGLKTNFSLIHLDVGSNDVTFEGAIQLFKTLESHPTLTSLTLANHDRLHRNRMGFKACEGLRDLLKKNQILSQINFSDNAISNEGLKIIGSGTFTKDSQLVSIIMSNNELQGAAAIQCFSQMLSQSKAIQELDLSDNNLGDPGMEEIARIYQQNANRLMKITLKNIQATSVSVGKLFFALKGNNFLTQLNLENNDLSGS